MKFELGQTVATPGAIQALANAQQSPFEFFERHFKGDWGEVDNHDRQENEIGVAQGFRVMSVYVLSTGEKIWVITEADRSSTTILLPEEY